MLLLDLPHEADQNSVYGGLGPNEIIVGGSIDPDLVKKDATEHGRPSRITHLSHLVGRTELPVVPVSDEHLPAQPDLPHNPNK